MLQYAHFRTLLIGWHMLYCSACQNDDIAPVRARGHTAVTLCTEVEDSDGEQSDEGILMKHFYFVCVLLS